MTDVSDELDVGRLADLQRLVGTDVAEIVATLVDELQRAVGAIGDALRREDLPAAAQAAHAARNSALMVDARPMLATLDALESGARRGDLPSMRRAERHLQASWPALRSQLERAASQSS